MANTILRNINLQPEVYDIIQAESARRRNGGKGFSLTLNQIVLEWLDAYNAGVVPLNVEALDTHHRSRITARVIGVSAGGPA